MSTHAFDPLASNAPLIVYVDHKSPYAYLAIAPTDALADELGIEIDWRPLTLDIPSFLGSARLGERGEVVESKRTPEQWLGVKHAYRDARRYAMLRGIVLRGTVKIWDSSLAGIAMLWAKAQGADVLRAYTYGVYQPFWRRELDIEDLDAIERVLREAGASVEGFRAHAAGEGRAAHEATQRAIFDAGIFGVPTYVVGGETFFGREHLPRVCWLLTGKRGPAPDVAYEGSSAAASVLTSAAGAGRLGVAIDFKSPQSYLALEPICALADALGVAVDWQPFVVAPPKEPPPRSDADDRGTRHRRHRAEYAQTDLRRYAASRGLGLGDPGRAADSTLAALGQLWVNQQAPSRARAYVERVFAAHWRESLDIADANTIARLLAEAGAPASGFASYATQDGVAELESLRAELIAARVYDVPSFRLGDEVFLGRQHLPLIRDLLV
ncbi:MAG: DsbA family protein [Myxococcota bacterium]